MDLIKTWMPTISAPTWPALRLPRLHPHLHSAQSTSAINSSTPSGTCTKSTTTSAASIAQNLRSESCRLLNRISCHFFEPRLPRRPAAANNRQTIQTDYISTISSLVEREQPDAVPTHVVHDAQSENFGLYALKCNRSGRGRGMLGAPPLLASPSSPELRCVPFESYTAEHPDDLVGEHFDIRPVGPPKRPPAPAAAMPTAPAAPATKARAPQPKPNAMPVPRITIASASPRNLMVEAENNGRARLELDTVYLEPLLIECTAHLATAAADICSGLMPAVAQSTANCTPHVAVSVGTELAEVHGNPSAQQSAARYQLLQQFANFTEELSNSPVQLINGGCQVSPRSAYVERFSRAFTAAFSEDEGVADSPATDVEVEVAPVIRTGDVAAAPQPTSNAAQAETLQPTAVANKSIVDSYAQSDLIRCSAAVAVSSTTVVVIAGESIISPRQKSSPAHSSTRSSSSSVSSASSSAGSSLPSSSSCTLAANGCDVAAVAGNRQYQRWLPSLADTDDADNVLAAAAAAAEQPHEWSGRHTWEQWTPQAAFYTCSPILEALNDEDEDCDEYACDGNGNGDGDGDGDVYLSVDNDINENAIGPGTEQLQRRSSATTTAAAAAASASELLPVHSCQAAVEVHSPLDGTAICPQQKWEPWTPTKTMELRTTGMVEPPPPAAARQLDNNDNYEGCAMGLGGPTIVRRMVYIVDL